jgi:hypothetical protein
MLSYSITRQDFYEASCSQQGCQEIASTGLYELIKFVKEIIPEIDK